MTVDERVDSGITEDLIRISTGTENIEDIIDEASYGGLILQSLSTRAILYLPVRHHRTLDF